MSEKSGGISHWIVAMFAPMFPMRGFEGGGLPKLGLTQEPVWVQAALNAMKMETQGGGPATMMPISGQDLVSGIHANIEKLLLTRLEDMRQGGGPSVRYDPAMITAMFMATEDQEDSGGTDFGMEAMVQHGFEVKELPDIKACQTGKDPGGGLPDAMIKVPGVTLDDKSYRYAGTDQIVDAMKINTQQGMQHMRQKQFHALAADTINQVTGFRFAA